MDGKTIALRNETSQKQYFKTRDFRQKADLARYEILSRYGGIYVDADFQFYRSLDVLNLNFPIVCHEDGNNLPTFRFPMDSLVSLQNIQPYVPLSTWLKAVG